MSFRRLSRAGLLDRKIPYYKCQHAEVPKDASDQICWYRSDSAGQGVQRLFQTWWSQTGRIQRLTPWIHLAQMGATFTAFPLSVVQSWRCQKGILTVCHPAQVVLELPDGGWESLICVTSWCLSLASFLPPPPLPPPPHQHRHIREGSQLEFRLFLLLLYCFLTPFPPSRASGLTKWCQQW